MTLDSPHRLTLTPIAQTRTQSRWRFEAMRAHSAPRLIFIARGQGRITVAGLTAGYGANNLIYVPARVMHGLEVGPTVFGQMLTIPAAMASDWPDAPVHLRLRDVPVQKQLAGHLDALERELSSDLPGHDRAALYQLGLLSIFFDRQMQARPAEAVDRRADTAAARLVAAYTDLIERDFRSAQGVAAYAAQLGVTPTHLTRCCKATCGKSALRLLNDRVLHEARVMLRDSKTPVNRIAAGLGFGSAAYFTRAFQSRTGLTPSAFRSREGGAPGFEARSLTNP
ncbi:helix-turn-helix transcriptional regulator [Thalassorhabdomicrobium marinisediminis]|uniref:AraC family transcriptional regulator n=1 Tax=Thalassorhabdomicrobium marinisediminis TaxID=2170577 RepID=A0A2T7FV82_9RHOB|nr:AraC family transcriptional regulator [Thalassorhabdomicrobium marinisediminis]PVA06077.1 AraC family transcriptional regulator [Thalassorhabdomicrobium marinisediminis]